VEEHASSHVDYMCVEEDQTTTFDTPLEPTNEADDNNVLDGYDADEKDVLAPNHDVDSVPYGMYDDATMIIPIHNKGSELCNEEDYLVEEKKLEILYEENSPRESHHFTVSSSELVGPLCDIPHNVDEMTLLELENRLLVTEEKIVQMLMRTDVTHKFIEYLMWKTQMEERRKGIANGVTSTQLCIIKEALEYMKSKYL
jgi:hypothetical protein